MMMYRVKAAHARKKIDKNKTYTMASLTKFSPVLQLERMTSFRPVHQCINVMTSFGIVHQRFSPV